jgi:hypothetical protein
MYTNRRTMAQRAIGDADSGRFSYVDLLPNWMVDTGAAGGASGDGGGDGNNDTGGSAGQGDGSNSGSGDSGADDAGTKTPVTPEELEAIMNRLKAADKRAADFEAKVKEHERAGQTEVEKAKADLAEKDVVIETMSRQLRDQAVQLAAMTSANHITWHDPSDALAFIMKDEQVAALEIRDGQVNAAIVKAAADRVAKAKPYLVKSGVEDDKGKGNNGQQQNNGNATGGSMNGDRKDGDGQADADKMRQKYPALRR